MPHFTLQVLQNGPIVTALIGVSQSRQVALTAAGQTIPPVVPIQALIDTGASCTCIDPSTIASLQLTPTGTVAMVTPSSGAQPHTTYQYDIGIVIPGPSASHAPFVLPTLAVAECALFASQGFHALIGRDVLEHCVLTYNGSTRLFILAY